MPRTTTAPDETEDIAKAVKKSAKKKKTKATRPPAKKRRRFLSSGVTWLDLFISGKARGGGYRLGSMLNLIGDSSAGKTILALTTLAEAANDPSLDKYRLILDDSEAAFNFDTRHMFGRKLAKRLEFVQTETVERWSAEVKEMCDAGTPFIYVLDSLDSLTSAAEKKRMAALVTKNKTRKEKKKKGEEVDELENEKAYNMEKAKILSENIRQLAGALEKTDSLLIIISQTRDDIDPKTMSKKKRNGGKALKFYCLHEIWVAYTGSIKKKVRNINREIGVSGKFNVTKNKVTGRRGQGAFFAFWDYGIDDILSLAEYLHVTEKWWKKCTRKKKKGIAADALGIFAPNVPSLVRSIEDGDLEEAAKEDAQACWDTVSEALKSKRKRRYE